MAFIAVALVAASGALPSAGAAEPLRLTVGTLGTIGSLDPRTGDSAIAHEVWNLQYPTLTALDPKTLDPAPGVATAWSPARNGRGWVYTIAPGLKWSDGRPVTGDDVVSSVERAGGTARALGVRSVEVTTSSPGVLVNVTPAHVLARTPDLDRNPAALGVADGQWHVTGRTHDSVQLDANGPGGPPLQQIVFRTYPNADALIAALDRKEVDVVSGLPASDATRLGALSKVTVDHAPDGTQYVLRDSLPDPRVRQAISLAIDRTELVAKTVDGIGTPGVVPILARSASSGLDEATTASLTASLDAQPERARQVLADAPPLTQPLELYVASDATSRRVAAYVSGALQQVGIDTTVVATDAPQKLKGRPPPLIIERASTTADEPAMSRAELQAATAAASTVGLFEPDTLQAFRTDNVTGFLRNPETRSLVVFAPTIAQYSQLVAASPPPGEQASDTTYAVGAVGVLAVCAIAFAVATWIRRRSIA